MFFDPWVVHGGAPTCGGSICFLASSGYAAGKVRLVCQNVGFPNAQWLNIAAMNTYYSPVAWPIYKLRTSPSWGGVPYIWSIHLKILRKQNSRFHREKACGKTANAAPN